MLKNFSEIEVTRFSWFLQESAPSLESNLASNDFEFDFIQLVHAIVLFKAHFDVAAPLVSR